MRRKRVRWGRVIGHRVLVVLILVWTLLPIYWVVSTSLKWPVDALATPPKFVFRPTLANYKGVFERFDFGAYLLNSLTVGLMSTSISLLLGAFAAYSLSRFKLRGARVILMLVLLVRMIPGIVLVFPLFQMFRVTHLLGTRWAVVLAHSTFCLPFTIWMVKGFVDDIPIEIEQAAMLDGCSRLGALFRVAMPLVAPGLAACFTLNFIGSWNEFMFAMILTSGQNRTLPALVVSFIDFMSVDYGRLTAASVMVMIPMMAFGMLVQRNLTRGLTLGAVH